MACSVCMGINSHKCPVCGKGQRYVECPRCGGDGQLYMAYDMRLGKAYRVTEQAYYLLPGDEEMAGSLNSHVRKDEVVDCPDCEGTGEVPEEETEKEYVCDYDI